MVNYSKLKKQLESKLAALEDRAERIEYRLSDPGSPDWEENAVLHANDEVLNVLNELTEHDIQDIHAALARIENGTYGVCTRCGSQIPTARLNLVPFTATCVACA